MNGKNEKQFSYKENIQKVIKAIKKSDYTAALIYIKCAVEENMDYPEVHNLLGIIAELNNNLSLAGKHYRASYALDPTYKPASINLERITNYYYNAYDIKPDYGDMPEPEEEVMPYIFTYNNKHIRNLKKAY